MYSPKIAERNIEQAEKITGISLVRYEPDVCLQLREELDSLRADDGTLRRPFTKREEQFILNERLLSKYDFKYWFERYCTMDRDGSISARFGAVGVCKLSESQEIVLKALGKAEEEEHEKFQRGAACNGLLFLFNKARQMYLTAIARALLMHRMVFQPGFRGLSASVDEDKIKELYDRDKKIYNLGRDKEDYAQNGGLPYWMRPDMHYDVKASHINFSRMGSSMLYQCSTQGSALGQGRQFDGVHCTELAYWAEDVLKLLDRDLFPTLPQSPLTLGLLESVSYGRSGWWYTMSKAVEAARMPRWRFCYIPWYVLSTKYIGDPPASWSPNEITQRHADMVWETSQQYCGERIRLSKEKLYWWETMRNEALDKDSLAWFLTNYCATPEEGHQHSNPTIISYEAMERLRTEASTAHPVPYLLRMGKTRTDRDDWTKGRVPSYQIGDDAIVPAHPDELDDDARGVVWMWEPPRPGASYVMGVDPTHGLIPWDRGIRREQDRENDNGCISILRVAADEGGPDVQVLEYAAPIDQEALGKVANLLGRIYGGTNEDGQALAVVEVHLALGLIVIRTMLDLGYDNHMPWQHIDKLAVQNTQSLGWYASPSAVRTLWEKFRRAVQMRYLTIRSKWLVEELADCVWVHEKQTAGAIPPNHDDRVRAISLAQWGARNWDMAPDRVATDKVEPEKPKVEWQRRLVSSEDMDREMEDMVQEWMDQ